MTEAAINSLKSQWDNDLAVPYDRRVSLGVSVGRKPRDSPGLGGPPRRNGEIQELGPRHTLRSDELLDPHISRISGFPSDHPGLPSYRMLNAGALRSEWARIPLPGWPDGPFDVYLDEEVSGAMSRPPSGGISSGAIKCSRSGFLPREEASRPQTTDGGGSAIHRRGTPNRCYVAIHHAPAHVIGNGPRKLAVQICRHLRTLGPLHAE